MIFCFFENGDFQKFALKNNPSTPFKRSLFYQNTEEGKQIFSRAHFSFRKFAFTYNKLIECFDCCFINI